MDQNLYAKRLTPYGRQSGFATFLVLHELRVMRRTLAMRPYQLGMPAGCPVNVSRLKHELFRGRLATGFLRIEKPKADSAKKCFLPPIMQDPEIQDSFIADFKRNMRGENTVPSGDVSTDRVTDSLRIEP